MQHACSLVVLILLQLCRAEISDALPEWYAANLINDAGYPKPITEIFTTPDTFSSKNPIIVTSTGYSSETKEAFSTLPTTTHTERTSTELPSADDATRRVIPLTEERQSASQPNDSPNPENQVTPQLESNSPTSSQPLDVEVQTHSPPPREISSSAPEPVDMPRQMYQPPPQQIQVLVAQPQIQPLQQMQQMQSPPQIPAAPIPPAPIPPSPQMPPVPNPPCPQIQMPTQPVNQRQTTGQPNYFLIYQQAPLSIQQYPESAQPRQSLPLTTQTTTQSAETQRTTQEATRTTAQPSSTTEEESRTTQSPTTYASTTSHSSNAARNIRQGQIVNRYWLDPSPFPGTTYYSPPVSSTIPLLNTSSLGKIATTSNTIAPSQSPTGKSGLTIRVSAPRGSITNIKINPSSTTKKPNSRRPQRKKGNNYNNCVESCKGKKEPLCAAPLAVLPIDPNKLRGFPSICHLACHNSFRKNQPYEKVMDGRCSRLRTRIRTFDKNKLKREELDKAQYTVLNNIPETIVQVIQNERSGGYRSR